MAKSVKLKDGSYIDASGVYDVNASKTQQDVNSSKFDKVGGTITGDVTFDGVLHNKSISGVSSSNIIIMPKVPTNVLGSGLTTEGYFKALLKWLCANYPNKNHPTFIGDGYPNSLSITMIHIYSTSDIDSSGYPKYAMGFALHLGGTINTFNFTGSGWSWKTVSMS